MNVYMIKQNILRGLDKGVRSDGRKFDEWRPVSIDYDISRSAEGSARIRFGGTEMLAGVKMGVEKPYPDTPDKGNLMVNAELVPLSNPEFETGPPSDQGIEVARVTDRGIRESHALNTETLCITPGEAVWSVIVDVVSINDEGNLLDASGLAAMAALTVARYPGIKDGKVDYEVRTDKKVALSCIPLPVTVYKIGKHLLVDPLTEEEKAADARLTVTTIEDGTVVALQKGGDVPLTIDEIDTMVGLAQEAATRLRKMLG
jgi:exosome complex component RRP42